MSCWKALTESCRFLEKSLFKGSLKSARRGWLWCRLMGIHWNVRWTNKKNLAGGDSPDSQTPGVTW
uniref:Uncharacterized protein n=1 Tax=Nelumbo nucifera TaxID=4432 RepID=A0A822YSR6_NELNU|nr:TPA_asm: hypothetical protein HUJ06_004765 [Nelumbo nucifera]